MKYKLLFVISWTKYRWLWYFVDKMHQDFAWFLSWKYKCFGSGTELISYTTPLCYIRPLVVQFLMKYKQGSLVSGCNSRCLFQMLNNRGIWILKPYKNVGGNWQLLAFSSSLCLTKSIFSAVLTARWPWLITSVIAVKSDFSKHERQQLLGLWLNNPFQWPSLSIF